MEELVHWSPPPENLQLGDGEVHIWRTRLEITPEKQTTLRESLAQDEVARADRFVFEADGTRFQAARGILRRLLSRYLSEETAGIRIQANSAGKPFVQGDLCFNLSHSGSLAVYVFAKNSHVGIDVERIRTDIDCLEIADRFFTESESQQLRTIPSARVQEFFFRGWTKKEAYVKARGEGLRTSLRSFNVSLAPGAPALLGNFDGSQWQVLSFIPEAGFVGAVAIRPELQRFSWWEFIL